MEPAGHDGEGKKEPAPSPADQMRATGSGRRKVALPPGRSQLDWIRNSRQIQTPYPRRLTMKEVKSHRSRESAWMVVRDQVFDVTPYVEYHPGGVDMIMLGAGRDATAMFDKYHPWVNPSFMLERCFLGYIEADDDGDKSSTGDDSSGHSLQGPEDSSNDV